MSVEMPELDFPMPLQDGRLANSMEEVVEMLGRRMTMAELWDVAKRTHAAGPKAVAGIYINNILNGLSLEETAELTQLEQEDDFQPKGSSHLDGTDR